MDRCLTLLAILITTAASTLAAEERIPSISPNKQIAIAEAPTHSGASWNPTSTKVALRVSSGTKLSELLLFSRADDGTFQAVELHPPDPATLYRQQTGKTIPNPATATAKTPSAPGSMKTSSCSSPEKPNNSPHEPTFDAPLDEYTHLFVTLKAPKAELSEIKLVGPLANPASKRFEKQWGQQYF